MKRFWFILLACAAIIGPQSSAQSIMVSGSGQSITVSGQAEAPAPQSPEKSAETPSAPEFKEVEPSEIDRLKSELADLKSLVAESTKKSSQHPALTVPNPEQHQQKAPRRYLAMFTASYCGPCQDWKRSVLPQLQSAGYRVEQIEMTNSLNRRTYGGQISRYPSFVVCDWDTGQWVSGVTVGYVDLATAKRMLGRSESKPDSSVVSYSGSTAPTVRQRLPVVDTQWGRIDLETYNKNCSCDMCKGIRQLQSQYRQMSIQKTLEPVNDHPGQQPTPADTLTQMVDLLRLAPSDVLADLGCGDGRILIAAVKQYGCRGVGVEIDADQARRARTAVDAAGLSDRITIITGDALEFEPQTHGITAITAYLFPHLLEKLAPRLKFARVVASPFHAIPGLQMTQHGDVWLYRQQNQPQPQQTTGITQIQIPGFNRADEIDHLMDPDSPHAGKFIRSNLERLTDMQLIDLHNREHGLHTVDGVRVSSR